MAAQHSIEVRPLPNWLPALIFLGDFSWTFEEADEGRIARADLPRREAALVQARLRGLGLDGSPIEVNVFPKIPRPWVREARRLEAIARRNKTKGFLKAGTLMDEEGRFSLTPEVLALEIGSLAKGKKILDLGCGVGGNSIGFARNGCGVISIERSQPRLRMAKHNASLYGVKKKVEFRTIDLESQPRLPAADIAFVDPPWGEKYDRICVEYDDLPLLSTIFSLPLQVSEYWLKLPPSFKTRTLPFSIQKIIPFFGRHEGDAHRIKFLLVTLVRP